ncbi:MAG: hypothetical protein RSG59_05125 [Ruthenibacterium sp.]
MGFFSGMYTKEGPGVPKNAPQKKGAARYFEIFMRDMGMLWKIGVLSTLCFVPCVLSAVFTCVSFPYLIPMLLGAVVFVASSLLVGPALCGLHAVVVTTLRDEPCYMMHVYKKAWKDNAKQSMPVGAVMMVLYATELYAGYFALTRQDKPSYIMLGLIALCLVLITTCAQMTLFQILFIDLPVFTMLKNSVMMTFGYTKRVLPAGLITLLCAGLIFGFVPWPLWLLVLLSGLVGFIALLADMWAWPAMEKAFHISEQLLERRAAEERAAALDAAAFSGVRGTPTALPAEDGKGAAFAADAADTDTNANA